MDFLVIIVLIKEIWERINLSAVVSLFILVSGGISGISAIYLMYDRYRYDRRRLKNFEEDISDMKDNVLNFKSKMSADFEQHKRDNTESFKELVLMIHSSNEKLYDKIDKKNKDVEDALHISNEKLYDHIDKKNTEVNDLLKEIRFSLMRKKNEK